MHLTFPNRHDRFTKEELRCLSAALGFPEDIFAKHIPLLYTTEECHFAETKFLCYSVLANARRFDCLWRGNLVICDLIERKVFNNDLHRTHNLHDGVYNARVLEKAVDVLSNRVISFADLKDIRIAFQFYECEDLSGLEINAQKILRTLKMCGRVISPRQLMDHMRHMPRCVSDRLMLYEFLELIPMCEKLCEVKKRLHAQTELKNRRRTTDPEVADFREILVQDDEKELDYLDEIYEKSFFRPSFNTKPTWRVQPREVINNKEWKKQVSSYRQVTVGLDETLGRSNRKVFRARHGIPDEYVQFVDLNIVNDKLRSSDTDAISTQIEKEDCKELRLSVFTNRTGNEITKDIPATASRSQFSSCPSPSTFLGAFCRQCWSESPAYLSKRSKLTDGKMLVTQQDVHDTQSKIVGLLWDLEMKDKLQKRKSDTGTKISPCYSEDNIEGNKDSPGTERENKAETTALKNQQKLSEQVATDQLFATTSHIYNFFNTRLEQRDSLLGRTSPTRSTRISRTQEGKSRKPRNSLETCRKFLSTA